MKSRRIIYLSPSIEHFDIGVGEYGSQEYRMNKITDLIVPMLEKKGYVVYRNNTEDKLNNIVVESNRLMPDIHLSLHSSKNDNMGKKGPCVYTNRKGTRADALANNICNELTKIYYDKNIVKGVMYTNSIYEVINTLSPAVLVELAFHDDLDDANWVIQNEQKIANAIVSGIEMYFA